MSRTVYHLHLRGVRDPFVLAPADEDAFLAQLRDGEDGEVHVGHGGLGTLGFQRSELVGYRAVDTREDDA